MKNFRSVFILLVIAILSAGDLSWVQAETELVASLEVLSSQVQLKRAGTDEWVLIARESLVGVGDSIRTDTNGRARVTFFSNGTDTEVLSNTEFRLDAFKGSEARFEISVTVVVGQTKQRISKLLDSGSSYKINSTGLEMAVRGTEFAVRVENSGRAATIVQNGAVRAMNPGDTSGTAAQVPAGYGIRAEAQRGLSEVVKADTFAQLDSALDGCGALISTAGDVVLNVRIGPGLGFERVGLLNNNIRQQVVGQTETTKWYRIPFKSSFGWVFAPALKLDGACAGLRKYPDKYGPEDLQRYKNLEPGYPAVADPEATATPAATATATPKP